MASYIDIHETTSTVQHLAWTLGNITENLTWTLGGNYNDMDPGAVIPRPWWVQVTGEK